MVAPKNRQQRRQAERAARRNAAKARTSLAPDLAAARQAHKEGRFKDADAGYDQVLASDPNNAEAMHFKGLLQYQSGNVASAEELLRETYRKIELINPKINAICTLLPLDEVINQARIIDCKRIQGERLPPLSGLPMAVKDLALTRDIKTTMGSPLFADHTPKEDCLLVERLRANGAILIGKTNTPEFGAGGNTRNLLFGVTSNPFDVEKTCGGSSGGSAVALATLSILPRSGKTAWVSRFRACFAEPPAESPSTINSSVPCEVVRVQSESFPGRRSFRVAD